MNLCDERYWRLVDAARISVLEKFLDQRVRHGIDIVVEVMDGEPITETLTWGYYAIHWDRRVVFWPEEVRASLVTDGYRFGYGKGHLGMF